MKLNKMEILDRIYFGELKGQSFIEIYKFAYSYLEWIIRDTEICFEDLDEFFLVGNPFDNSYSCLSKEAMEELKSHVVENNRMSVYKQKRINYTNIKFLKDSGLINYKDLCELDYRFPSDIVAINNEKLKQMKLL